MADQTEIAGEMKRLTSSMPPPRGVDFDKAYPGYVQALCGFAAEEIHEAIDRYLAGEFTDLSLKFFPRPPELGALCRKVRTERAAVHQAKLRAETQREEMREHREAAERAKKTPEQLAKGRAIYAEFLESRAEHLAAERAAQQGKNKRLAITEEELYRSVNARLDARRGLPVADPAEALISARERHGMTAEVLERIKDRPLPKGMKPVAAIAAPVVARLPPPSDLLEE